MKRPMAIRKADQRRHLLLLAVVFFTVAFIAMSKWDEEDFARMRAEAVNAPTHAVHAVATVKQDFLRYAVEESNHREYFASDFHCRAPLKGERLEMQHASPRDPGKGYRCLYRIVQQPPGVTPVANVTWSRSPEVKETIAIGRPR